MGTGFEYALGEVTLVLFTTLAPSSVFAFMLVAVYLLFAPLEFEERRKINQFVVIPLTISMVGLIASATHLGNPANALYVFLGVGRSPLSTEVFFAIVFLMFAGTFWLYSFTEKKHLAIQKVWLVLIILSGIAFITAIAFAYDAETIISWNTVYVPLNLWLNAIVGGPLLALLTLQVAKAPVDPRGLFTRAMWGLSGVALIANALSLFLQNATLGDIQNSYLVAKDLVPYYEVMIVVFIVLAVLGIAVYARVSSKGNFPSLPLSIAACASVLVGIFVIRFGFYMMHMTVGVSF